MQMLQAMPRKRCWFQEAPGKERKSSPTLRCALCFSGIKNSEANTSEKGQSKKHGSSDL